MTGHANGEKGGSAGGFGVGLPHTAIRAKVAVAVAAAAAAAAEDERQQ